MKKVITFLGLAGSLIPATLFAQNNSYTLNGKIGHLTAPAKAYLMYSTAAGRQTDSVLINDGVFSFKGSVENPLSAYLFINKQGTGLRSRALNIKQLYLEPGMIDVTSSDSLDNALVKGGQIDTDNEKLNELLGSVSEKNDGIK